MGRAHLHQFGIGGGGSEVGGVWGARDAWGALTFTSSGLEVGVVKLGACGVRVTRGARSPSPAP